MAERPLPPINHASSLVARTSQDEDELQRDTTSIEPSPDNMSFAALSLKRSQEAVSGMKRAMSAPHSMDLLGLESHQHQRLRQHQADAQQLTEYLPPSGGPMRRVATSLGMRRSSSFFWAKSAHRDFERAVDELNARGVEPTAPAVHSIMKVLHNDLTIADIEKHSKKKALVERHIMKHLSNPTSPMPPMRSVEEESISMLLDQAPEASDST